VKDYMREIKVLAQQIRNAQQSCWDAWDAKDAKRAREAATAANELVRRRNAMLDALLAFKRR
jgi:hypothetical protein